MLHQMDVQTLAEIKNQIQDSLTTGVSVNGEAAKTLNGSSPLHRIFYNLFTSEIGLSCVIAVLSICIVAFLLVSRYLASPSVEVSEMSASDVRADQTLQVEDKDATDQLRYEARQKINPIYKRDTQTENTIRDRFTNLLENIEVTRTNKDLPDEDRHSTLSNLLNQQEPPPPNVVETLLNVSNWDEFSSASIQTLENILERGISSDSYSTDKDSLAEQALPDNSGLSGREKIAVDYLITSKIRPTLLIDEKSTEEAKDEAASKIKPVIETFHKGDLIVRKGHRISALANAALQKEGVVSSKHRWLTILGVVLLTISLLSIVWGYLYRFEHSNFFKPAYASLLATMMVLSVGGFALLTDLPMGFPVEMYPIAMMSLMVCIFTHPRIAILTTMMILLLCGLALKIPLETLSVLVISSLVGIFVLARKPVPKDRNDLLVAGLALGVAQGVSVWATSLIYEPISGETHTHLLFRAMAGIFSGVAAGIFTLGFLPLVESLFKLVTPYTLLELANHDRPILKRMQIEAPGTFHHSLMVAALSETAAEAVGANPILTHVGALYHDIGKIKRPAFFVENQAYLGIENPHDKLAPRLSKMVITAHPRDGVEMGRQLGLPKVILRFMPEHHGTMIAGYFYHKAAQEEGAENVNKNQFRYPGPKPQSRETAIVMLADACESAVRALKNPTPQQVEDRIDKIFHQRIDDGQFNDCPITFQEIAVIRETFLRVLRGIQHSRIEYQQNILEELGKKAGVMPGGLIVPPGNATATTTPSNGGSEPKAPNGRRNEVLDAETLQELQALEKEEKAAAVAHHDEEEHIGEDCC